MTETLISSNCRIIQDSVHLICVFGLRQETQNCPKISNKGIFNRECLGYGKQRNHSRASI